MDYTRLFPGFSPGRLRPPGEGGLTGNDIIRPLRIPDLGHDLVGQVIELIGSLQNIAYIALRTEHLKSSLNLITIMTKRGLDKVNVIGTILDSSKIVALRLGRMAMTNVLDKGLSKNRSSAVKNGPSHVVHVFSFIEWLLVTLELYVLGFKVFAQ